MLELQNECDEIAKVCPFETVGVAFNKHHKVRLLVASEKGRRPWNSVTDEEVLLIMILQAS